MNTLAKYSIAHKGLAAGTHHYSFKMGNDFFEAFEGSEIQRGDVCAEVTLHKESSLVKLDIKLQGEVCVPCDRCLEEFNMPVEYNGVLCVRFSDTEQENDGDVMWLSVAETEIPLAQYLYESICLSLPYRRIHPVNEQGECGCNPDMLNRFRIVSEEEFNQISSEKPINVSPGCHMEKSTELASEESKLTIKNQSDEK